MYKNKLYNLNNPVDICVNRIIKRNGKEEKSLDKNYLN